MSWPLNLCQQKKKFIFHSTEWDDYNNIWIRMNHLENPLRCTRIFQGERLEVSTLMLHFLLLFVITIVMLNVGQYLLICCTVKIFLAFFSSHSVVLCIIKFIAQYFMHKLVMIQRLRDLFNLLYPLALIPFMQFKYLFFSFS